MNEHIIKINNMLKNKRCDKRIILGCGCFEIFHIGHLEYLTEAKKLGDILIIGVNSDEYIKRRKHRTPLFDIDQRLKIIGNIKAVDYAFPFDEDTCSQAIEVLKPDIFVKGVDRLIIEETQICQKYGITIKKVGTEKKYSSTLLRDVLSEKYIGHV